jgi:GDPmannose 4,6-dehydratase
LKCALITGITGQDGAHLARFLLQKDYKVFGACRRLASSDLWRLEALGILEHPNLTLLNYDGTDPASAVRTVTMASPDEVYNLAAQTHVGRSFEMPHATATITGLGVLNILDAVRERRPEAKFLQASSSELFGNTTIAPQNEDTPFKPRSPYGAAKLFGYSLTVNYAEAYGMFASNVILFNHESPLRSTEFVTRKVTSAVADYVVNERFPLLLGNLSARRDWGAAREYVDGMWRILQAPAPDAFVLATGRSESIRTLVNLAYGTQGIVLEWQGAGREERGLCRTTGRVIVRVDDTFYRPSEVEFLLGDPRKAATELNWRPKIVLETIIAEMVEADISRAKSRLISL